tara:strand:+ start:3112 stop:6081 length:2970 start_codon:yes stop_codon:yes gene_type:complete
MVPTKLDSFSDFVDTFGSPIGGTEPGDVWREGNITAPTFGAYAAQAWLKNSAPLTYVRLLGVQEEGAAVAGQAGWSAGVADSTVASGGAWGLFVFPSGSISAGNTTTASGALAATFYLPAGRVFLSGTRVDRAGTDANQTTGSCCELYEITNDSYTIGITKDGTVGNTKKVNFSLLDKTKANFIRNVINTNPTISNTDITSTATLDSTQGGLYWLGESFERSLTAVGDSSVGVLGGSIASKAHAVILPLVDQTATTSQQSKFTFGATKGTTGWFIAQDLSGDPANFAAKSQQKLFRVEALTLGQSVQESIKISIEKIKAARGEFAQYGSFSLVVRSIGDTDSAPTILERFDSLDLNPASSNFIGKVVGTKYEQYDSKIKDNRVYGAYPNRSKYIRVELHPEVERGTVDTRYLPWGVFGPLKYRGVTFVSGGQYFTAAAPSLLPVSAANSSVSVTDKTMVNGGNQLARAAMGMTGFGDIGGNLQFLATNNVAYGGSGSPITYGNLFKNSDHVPGGGGMSGSIVFPSVPLRKQSIWGRPRSNNSVYWGAWTGRTGADPKVNEGLSDLLRVRCNGLEANPASTSRDLDGEIAYRTSDALQIAWCFSLDDISGSFVAGSTVPVSGTYSNTHRKKQLSISANRTYTGTLDAGYGQFTTVLHGGFDGFNVRERDPFRMSTAFAAATAEDQSYQLHTLKRAVNLVSDADVVQMNLASMPGITHNVATNYLLDTAEDRGDALAVIDIQNVYTPDTEDANAELSRNSFTIDQAVNTLKDRNINSSYGATYAPWVRIMDPVTSRTLWAPPSIAAIGAYSHTDNRTAPWFAPAGFSRGGLTDGAAGIPVLDVSKRLTSDDRDKLYEANINPIAKFPAEGIVIFGQKTLQQTRSALDRINVRRLMIYLKREMSFIASRLLFAPNVPDTWARFTGKATPILDKVKAQYGIDEFRLILDETTTTPDLIDQNIIYAKLLVKPTKAVEFFAIDFVVTNSGAGFED